MTKNSSSKIFLALSVMGLLVLTACSSNTAATPTASVPASSVPTVTPTSPAPTPSESVQCASTNLTFTWGQEQGAAGTVYRTLVATNSGTAPCVLTTAPTVTLFTQFANSPATVVNTVVVPSGLDLGLPVTLAAGAALDLPIGTSSPDNYSDKDCKKAIANHVAIRMIQDPTSVELRVASWPACTTANAAPFFSAFTLE